MKYLCLGYLNRVEMDSRTKTEIDGIMAECWPHIETLYKTGNVVIAPIILGRGVPLWTGLEGMHKRFTTTSVSLPSGVTHLFFEKR